MTLEHARTVKRPRNPGPVSSVGKWFTWTPDIYTMAMLSFEGEDGSDTIEDWTGRIWTEETPGGSYNVNRGIKKIGLASGNFANTHIESVDSIDWRLDGGANANHWAFDTWIYIKDLKTSGIFQQFVNVSNFFGLFYNLGSAALVFTVRSAGTNIVSISNAWSPTINTWYHLAFVKLGTTGYRAYIDGVQIGTTQTNSSIIPDFAAPMLVGKYTLPTGIEYTLDGNLDHTRFSKGNSRFPTSPFTPPSIENDYI